MTKDDLLEHLRELPDPSFAALYENIWAVIAVLRSLPQLARQVLSREVEYGDRGIGFGECAYAVGERRGRGFAQRGGGSVGRAVMWLLRAVRGRR